RVDRLVFAATQHWRPAWRCNGAARHCAKRQSSFVSRIHNHMVMDAAVLFSFCPRWLVAHCSGLIARSIKSNKGALAMSELDTSLFVARDRTLHPRALTPDYKTSVARSPQQALITIPPSVSETTGPDFSHLEFG